MSVEGRHERLFSFVAAFDVYSAGEGGNQDCGGALTTMLHGPLLLSSTHQLPSLGR